MHDRRFKQTCRGRGHGALEEGGLIDTRRKILDAVQALALARQWRGEGVRPIVVTGCFDLLHAAHARRLAAISKPGRPLLVIVSEPRDPVLPARARAELVAALRMVDYILLAEFLPLADGLLTEMQAEKLEAVDDGQLTGELIADVRRRHTG
ncbi:MAG: hypothetical protein WD696_11045 [Bryobacteraceae bacterium]